MADEVATVSSSPAFGFAAAVVVISDQSYSASPLHDVSHRGDRLVDEPDCQPDEDPLAEPSARERQGHLLADAQDAVVHGRPIRANEKPHDKAERHAFLEAA